MEYIKALSVINLLGISTIAIPLVFVFGAVIGSFLNVLIWRLPREEKLNGRSHCPNCNHKLVWYDLIPVLSYVVSKGVCRYCKQQISFRYPLIEILTGVLFVLAVLAFPFTSVFSSLLLLKAMVVIAVCVVVFMIDFEHYLILDKVVLFGTIMIGLLLVALGISDGSINHLIYGILASISASTPFWLLWVISKGRWMGLGDVKFIAFMGLALGLSGILVSLFLAFGIGALVGIALILIGKKQLTSKLPFGTFLSLATVVTVLYGARLWDLYWGIFVL